MKDRIINLPITENDLGQIIDCLEVRRESWTKTADWFRGTLDDPFFVIEECNDQPPFPRPPIRPNDCSRGLPPKANS